MKVRPHFLGALLVGALLAIACGGNAESDSESSSDVPALPSYIREFDPSVRELIESLHGELLADPQNPERWMKLGMAYEAHSEAGQAVPCYERALELRSEAARGWYRLAMARHGSDQINSALTALDRSIALNDRYAPSHWRRGMWLLEVTREKEARESFRRAVELDPQDPAGHLGLVQVHLRLGENEQAAEMLAGSPLLQGANGPWASKLLGTAYQRMGKENQARILLAISKSAAPSYRDQWNAEIDVYRRGVASINRQARALIAAGQAPQAILILERSRAQNPEHVPILRTLGAAYAAAGRPRDAFDVLQAAVELEPQNTELRVDAAWTYAMKGELQAALGDVLEILQDAPDNNKAHILHAQVLLDLERPEGAINAFEKAMEFGARNPAMLVDIGKKQIELQRLDDARASFELAAAQDPALQSAWIGLAMVCIEFQDLAAAAQALTRAQELAILQPHGGDPVLAAIRDHLATLQETANAKAESDDQ